MYYNTYTHVCMVMEYLCPEISGQFYIISKRMAKMIL